MFENLRTPKGIALIAVFAALHTVLSTLPYTITIGISGSITLGVVSAPLLGIILGPISGGIAAMIGSIIAMFTNPAGAIMGAASFIPATVGAISTGFVIKKRGYISAALLAVGILAFYLQPSAGQMLEYPFMHIIALAVALIFSTKLAMWDAELSDLTKLSLAIPIAAFVGTLTDHIIGTSIAAWMYDLGPSVFTPVLFVYPVERIIAVIIATAIAIPLYYSLKRSGIFDLIK
ncbi:MAG: hypothetical protein NWF03_03550 [Candidatus Bathyarchaeota archaeon]|nr:hypothetical protein [Candidatus Bathyarchaeota archaeon]